MEDVEAVLLILIVYMLTSKKRTQLIRTYRTHQYICRPWDFDDIPDENVPHMFR
jgi:hypothetical protein